jgi:general secretion pathway protein H
MKSRNRASGFTLIELILVLIILSVITALVVPRLTQSLSRMNVESSARRVASALRLARSLAVTEKVPYRAVFNMNGHTLSIVTYQQTSNDADPEESGAARPVEPRVYALTDGIHFEEGMSSNGETVTSGGFEMVFYPGGGTSGGEVVLGDDEGRSFSIGLDTITGSVKIKDRISGD